MPFYRCGSSVDTSETLLFTNDNPTATWGTQSATLSQPYTDFDYLKIYYRFSTSNATESYIIVSKEILQKSSTVASFTIGMNIGSGSTRIRPACADTNTSIKLWTSYQATQSSQTASSSYIIPTKITGFMKSLPVMPITLGILGRATKSLASGSSTTISVSLSESNLSLDQVVAFVTSFTMNGTTWAESRTVNQPSVTKISGSTATVVVKHNVYEDHAVNASLTVTVYKI